jgi:prepilin-type processing-associated H-X9-DG protein
VGLVWNQETISRLLGEQGLGAAATNVNTLALLKLSGVPAPAATMVLTELISPDNNLKGGAFAAIDGPGSQVVQPLNGVTCVHHGRYNYLMLDGHVERMSPLQAQDSAGNQRIWSIKKSD